MVVLLTLVSSAYLSISQLRNSMAATRMPESRKNELPHVKQTVQLQTSCTKTTPYIFQIWYAKKTAFTSKGWPETPPKRKVPFSSFLLHQTLSQKEAKTETTKWETRANQTRLVSPLGPPVEVRIRVRTCFCSLFQ